MRRQRSIVVFLIVILSSAGHAFAQSNAEPPPAPPRKTPTPIPAVLGGVQRPQALGFGDNGESGTYTYDGSGNITAIGTDTFLYDAEGRLVTAVTRGVTGSYTYDAFGNRKTATGETNCYGQTVCATPLTVSSSTNRLLTTTANGSTTNAGYDAAGNITSASGGVYSYDGTGMMTQATVGSDDRQFVYTADDERIAVRQGVSWTWTVRGMDNKVLREFTSVEPNNSTGFPTPGGQWKKDYIWRDGLLLASTDTTGTYHYHLDHLGTPRLITNTSGVKIAEHAYYPFGAEISLTPHESNEEAMKFTGHERDIVAGDGHTLDDMHARYYNASLGRFLEVDPVLGRLDRPQSLNRYSYAANNPTNLLDPDGRATALAILPPGALDELWMSFGSAVAATAAAPAPNAKLAAVANAVNRTADWIMGEGSEQMVFVPGSVEVAQMQHAPGVNRARSAFHNKNASNIAKHQPLEPLTDFGGRFGPSEFLTATLDGNATQHFVGKFDVDIRPEPSGVVRFTVTNTTSFTSATGFLRALGVPKMPDWNRGPLLSKMGNVSQVYTWTEPVP